MNQSDLTEDQNLAIDRLYNFDETFLIAPTGAGKTVILLTAIAELIKAGFLSRVLIIAPLKVCVTTWSNEAQKWGHLAGLHISLAVGSPTEREDAIARYPDILIVNEENVPWLLDTGAQDDFDGIAIDETSKWNSGGARFKAIRHKMKNFKWRVGMTAEPVAHDWVRLFAQLLLIDLGKALGKSKDRYRRRYLYPTDWDQRKWEVLPHKVPSLIKKIHPVVHVMPDDKEETLPPKTVTIVPIELPAVAWERYNRMRIDSELTVGEEIVEAKNRAVLSGKLEQIAAGFSYLGDNSDPAYVLVHHVEKILWAVDRAYEILRSDESVIVVYWYQWELEMLRCRLPGPLELNGTAKEIARSMEDWRERPGQIMLLQPSSASHGVDGLQDTCHRQLWLGPIWSRDRTEQCYGRLWRWGQTEPVEIEVAVAVGTVDEIKIASVDDKAKHHKLLTEHLGGNGLSKAERDALSEAM